MIDLLHEYVEYEDVSISDESIEEADTEEVIDRLFDGTPYPETEEGIKALLERMDSREALIISEEEIAQFEEEIARSREEQKELERLSWETETDLPK